MGMFVIERTSPKGGYVAKSGHHSSYTSDLRAARKFYTREDAEKHLCTGNEVVVDFEAIVMSMRY